MRPDSALVTAVTLWNHQFEETGLRDSLDVFFTGSPVAIGFCRVLQEQRLQAFSAMNEVSQSRSCFVPARELEIIENVSHFYSLFLGCKRRLHETGIRLGSLIN